MIEGGLQDGQGQKQIDKQPIDSVSVLHSTLIIVLLLCLLLLRWPSIGIYHCMPATTILRRSFTPVGSFNRLPFSSSLLLFAVSLSTSSFRINSPSPLLSIFVIVRLSDSAVSPTRGFPCHDHRRARLCDRPRAIPKLTSIDSNQEAYLYTSSAIFRPLSAIAAMSDSPSIPTSNPPPYEASAPPPAAPAPVEHLNIKVTDNNNEVFFKIKRSTNLKKLMDAFCDRQGKQMSTVRFLFDGTRVRPEYTPDTVCLPRAGFIVLNRG